MPRKNRRRFTLFFVACCLAIGSSTEVRSQFEPNKNLILAGHDAPTTQRYLDSLNGYEKLPFDGFAVILESNAAGTKVCEHPHPLRLTFSETHWEEDWFADSISRLTTANLQMKRETFLSVNCNPGEVDWFDDVGWQAITDHLRIIAKAVKKSGSAGIIFDPEPYPSDKPIIAFCYDRQSDRGKHPFVEYQLKARQRGRETMRAMAEECPDLKILSYFFLSYLTAPVSYRGPDVLDGDSVDAAMSTHHYNLLVPFFIGWLEAAPPTVTLIDGNENAYYYTNESEYEAAADQVLRQSLQLIPPEHRKKYTDQVRLGSSVYLDNCQPQHQLFMSIENHSPTQILESRLAWSLKSSEQYVWIWAEGGRFLELPDGIETSLSSRPHRYQFPHWNELFPGALKTIELMHDSNSKVDFLAKSLASDLAENLAKELFSEDSVIAKIDGKRSWYGWQPKWSAGSLEWNLTDESFDIAGSSGGVLVSDMEVQPGQTIHLRARLTSLGTGQPYVMLAFLDDKKSPLRGTSFTPVTTSQQSHEEGKMEIHGRWIIPSNCRNARFIVGASSQGSSSDVIKIFEAQAFLITPR